MSDLPRELPLRENDAELGAAALDDIRKKIAAHVESTQGAWVKLPWLRRSWAFVLAIVLGLGWSGFLVVAGGVVGAAAALATLAALGAFAAVLRAPLAPSWSERTARIGLALGCLALATEIGLAYFASEPYVVDAAHDMACARTIILGAVLPAVFLAIYLRSSRAPARLFHVVAVAGAAFLMSAAAVWAECPANEMRHVLVAHSAAPLLAAVVVVVALRPLLRGARIG